jgi:hypothetical protein
MGTLRDFIAARRAEIKGQIQDLKSELVELDKAESAIASDGEMATSQGNAPRPAKRRRIDGGIKNMVLQSLLMNFSGLTANSILESIKVIYGIEVARTSLSPQLSRLKNDGKVAVENSIWRITEKGVADIA